MKYSASILIQKPRDEVVELFRDPDNLGHYQTGFVSKSTVSGSPGKVGAISEMRYEFRGKPMMLKETIISDELPDVFEASYEHPMMENTLKTSFESTAENETRYSIEVDYFAINGMVPRLLAKFFPSMFTRQGKEWMANFKQFVESQ